MLQINTGKLFSRDIERINRLTGVLYSNVRLPSERDIATKAGLLRGTGFGPANMALVYELEERIEQGPKGPGVLVSHTVGPFLDDFAVVAAFGLEAVFSREPASVRALTDGRPGFSLNYNPSEFLTRFFDQTVYVTSDQAVEFEQFVQDLLSLERRSFLGAMQAMRTLIAGLYQIANNLGQAYTMMVSAVESLAQDFDKFTPTWNDIDERKRRSIDAAMSRLSDRTANPIRQAILSREHLALSRRYRHFTLSHIDDGFFIRPTRSVRPLARYELEPGIKKAYDLRSAYIHQLRQLPDSISYPHAHWEAVEIEREPALTFEGLYRVTRQVILSFIAQQPKLDREEYDYRLEQAGIMTAELAAQYWVWKPILDAREARRRLEGLLNLVVPVLNREPDAQLVDMTSALADVEKLLPGARAEFRPALLSLHFLFNLLLSPEQRSPGFEKFYRKHATEAGEPTIDSIVVATIFNAVEGWSTEVYSHTLDQYFSQRVRKKGLHAPRLIEAAMCLTLAEKFRLNGNAVGAREQIRRALETHPAHSGLRELAAGELPNSISWRDILLPPAQNSGETKN